jgi:hypothetical protein
LADEGDDIIFDVMLAFKCIDFNSIRKRVAEQVKTVRFSNYVLNNAVLTGYDKISILQVRQGLDYPVFPFVFSKLDHYSGVKKRY